MSEKIIYLYGVLTNKPPFPYEKGYLNYIGNFDYVDKLASIINDLIVGEATGTYNVGTRLKTIYELSQKTNSNTTLAIGSYKPPRQIVDTSMDLTKLHRFLRERLK